MDDQLTLRLPADLTRRLERLAKAHGVKRSVIVREALEQFLGAAVPTPPSVVRERMARYVGAVRLTPAGSERDALAKAMREHNWRE